MPQGATGAELMLQLYFIVLNAVGVPVQIYFEGGS